MLTQQCTVLKIRRGFERPFRRVSTTSQASIVPIMNHTPTQLFRAQFSAISTDHAVT